MIKKFCAYTSRNYVLTQLEIKVEADHISEIKVDAD